MVPALRLLVLLAVASLVGCAGFSALHEIQGDNFDQVLQSEESQVKVRNAQSRVYDTTDRQRMVEAVIATYQDLGFQIEVLDPVLGIVSGKKYLADQRPGAQGLASYLMYDEESLVVFNRVYRNWGPFKARADMVRLTTTIRQRNAEQMIVRTSAQYFLRAVETPDAYQKFYATLQQALFAEVAARDPEATPDEAPIVEDDAL